MTTSQRTFLGVMIGGAVVLAIALGVRHSFGLFLSPMSDDYGWGRETFAFAIAIQNLVWGLAQPFTGAFADRFGAGRVILVGAVVYALGLWGMSGAATPLMLTMSTGVLIGLALSATSFSVILGAVGRVVPDAQRPMAMGLVSAAGSLGQFLMLPGVLGMIRGFGWQGALIGLAILALMMLPFASMVRVRAAQPLPNTPAQTLSQALGEAFSRPDFWLLSLGFFVCGFQLVFIGLHLPAYLVDQQLPATVGTTVLALVGLFNIVGTWLAGWLGSRLFRAGLLAWIYLLRSVVIVLFLWLPLTPWSAYLFGMAMGVLWLSTVPLTNSIVATIFGVRNLSMLGGIVFLFHQVGSFAGGWLGGYLFDRTGSYELVWQISIGLGVLAALLNMRVTERPVARIQTVQEAG
ncbi:major facilitator superfamily transporter [Alcanivorax sp. S71-1-4]|uniref:MFS transporter n=1 Tax=Alcanivorax sp. S71-1-4 TaxID=1177159 RepID=UPI001357FF54|nr:MFS transporter [Alcanivorax sp. S71-1-4]KAF0807867.1 major facilitator superfamily transporter [Alcanivorax sp. S71-1-4]